MFLHTCTKNHHHILCGSWFGTQWKLLFFILGYFLHFNLPNSLKNQNFLKMKKTTGDIIILHMCPKNHDHMPYGSWDMVHNGCQCYFSFWAIFCSFTPFKSPKNFKKMKKTSGGIIILHMCIKNYDQLMYGTWDIVRNGRTDRRTEKVTFRGGCPTQKKLRWWFFLILLKKCEGDLKIKLCGKRLHISY